MVFIYLFIYLFWTKQNENKVEVNELDLGWPTFHSI